MLELPSPCLVVIVGPAGSGKTTWANAHFPGRVVGSDSLRSLVGEGEDDLRASADAFAVLDDVIERRLRRLLTTVVDTLGSDTDRRERWRQLAARLHVPCHAVVLTTARADVRRWNRARASWTTLAHLAACTDTIRLGTMVSGITHRSVPLLAKIVATLDVVSGGRAICRLGVGWYEQEHRAYGWPFPPVGDRYALLEDALALLPVMWGAGSKPFDGRVLHVPDTSCYPRPLQQRIPLLVGGSGERRTLKLIAAAADACNLFGEPDVVRRKVDVLHRHCADAGRDPAAVSVSHLSTVLVGVDATHVRALVDATKPPRTSVERHGRAVNAGTTEQHVARIERYVDAGVDHVVVALADIADVTAIEGYGAVIRAARTSVSC